jgi:hypothetical protein
MFCLFGRLIDVGVYETEQLVDPPMNARVQVVELKVPVALLENVAVPFGSIMGPVSVSLTVALQDVTVPLATGFGAQTVLAVVLRLFTTSCVVPELVACVGSPP